MDTPKFVLGLANLERINFTANEKNCQVRNLATCLIASRQQIKVHIAQWITTAIMIYLFLERYFFS